MLEGMGLGTDMDKEHNCMCGGGKDYHNTDKVLRNLETEMKAALNYAQAYINDESGKFEFRNRIFKKLEWLQASFKIYGPLR